VAIEIAIRMRFLLYPSEFSTLPYYVITTRLRRYLQLGDCVLFLRRESRLKIKSQLFSEETRVPTLSRQLLTGARVGKLENRR
jgi:predicted LPLAT superfamily acyltransferase